MVKESLVPGKEFYVTVEEQNIPILDASVKAPNMAENVDKPDLCEYLVRIEWLKTVPRSEACWEKGLFAIQHTVCRLRNRFTLERLTQHSGLDE